MKCKLLIINNKNINLPAEMRRIFSQKALNWLLNSEYENAIIELKNSKVIWHMGTWYRGHWHGDIWKDGVWFNGFWHDGKWINGIWHNGIWLDGIWYNGVWKKGTWKKGEKKKTYSL